MQKPRYVCRLPRRGPTLLSPYAGRVADGMGPLASSVHLSLALEPICTQFREQWTLNTLKFYSPDSGLCRHAQSVAHERPGNIS
ncbi:hypothetical protein chiPu_0020910 [Chiloscyllium punctatum]|uniref:Uncharacterized protein n=1 Tax=Chiloscyllium punctatum TaxID=137246 RepID=A0A401RL87_CHIPU|nr:hypothetical protein [Chiloscyllium punctatum]